MKLRRGLFPVCLVSLVALAVAGGCGATTAGIPGTGCAADGDCNPGLKCLPYEGYGDAGVAGGCVSAGNECLIPCKANADCTLAGPGLVCFTSCGTAACEAPGVMGLPLDVGSDAGSTAPTDAMDAAHTTDATPE